MLEILRALYAYNSWATNQLLGSVSQLSEQEYNAPGCSGLGSIRDTLAHMLSAQWRWFCWFDKSKSIEESLTQKLTPQEIDTYEKLKARWVNIDAQTNNCLEKFTDDSVKEIWSATTPRGLSISLPLWKLLLQISNHGTHTRGQVIAAIRRFGHNPGVYEFLMFSMEQKK